MSMPGGMTMPNVLRGSYSGGAGEGHDGSSDLADPAPGKQGAGLAWGPCLSSPWSFGGDPWAFLL